MPNVCMTTTVGAAFGVTSPSRHPAGSPWACDWTTRHRPPRGQRAPTGAHRSRLPARVAQWRRLRRARRGLHPRRHPGLPPRPRPRPDDGRREPSGVCAQAAHDGGRRRGRGRLVRAGLLPRGAPRAARPGALAEEAARQRDVRRPARRAHPRGAARPPRAGVGARGSSARRPHRAQARRAVHEHADAAARVTRRHSPRAAARLGAVPGERDVVRVRHPQAASPRPRRGDGAADRPGRDGPCPASEARRRLRHHRRAAASTWRFRGTPRAPSASRGRPC